MKIIDATEYYKKMGFEGAVMINGVDIDAPKEILEFIIECKKEGERRRLVVCMDEQNQILVQIGEGGDQRMFPLAEMGEEMHKFVDPFRTNE